MLTGIASNCMKLTSNCSIRSISTSSSSYSFKSYRSTKFTKLSNNNASSNSSAEIFDETEKSDRRKNMVRRRDYRFAYPEFLPDPEPVYRNGLREKLERRDMLARRENSVLPEFYVGSIVAVTTTKSQVEGPSKEARFVGIVIDRGGTGLRTWMLIRNYITGVGGVECMVDLYSPSVKEIEVLKLEKRLDDELYYLRDCDPKYCMVPLDMVAEKAPENKPIPINDLVVQLGPKPWHKKWDRYTDFLSGYMIEYGYLDERTLKKQDNFNSYLSAGWQSKYVKYDLMRDYFLSIPIEEQDAIWAEVGPALENREIDIKRLAAKKALAKSTKSKRNK